MADSSDETPGAEQGISGSPPGRYSSFQNERAARKVLESTARANIAAFHEYEIVPSMLRKEANKRSLQVELFGVKHSSPLLLAPIGVQGIVHPDGEEAVAKAAQELGIGMILSTAATRSIEKVAQASGDGLRWFQLYWPPENEITISLLRRAKASGYQALVCTLDTFSLGYRPRDLEQSYLPFLQGQGLQNLFTDPAFMKINEAQIRDEDQHMRLVQLSVAGLAQTSSGIFRTWEDLGFLRKHWEGPLIIKGIQRVADAEKAIDFGIDGIIVSNHGGRQVDGATASLRALDRITSSPKVINSKITILFDSGIRTGADIIKALAPGAHAVLLGRPYVWGSALGGKAGVEHVIKSILADLEISMALCGKGRIAELDRSILASARARARL
ncbi:MAG: hypothetical protein CYPHOPRED_004078 [Cyphobasidiales sp. Tagirdzhanova-0007]|nr:MAG: hypothetical protein CYPHOPRED_004078 [Cyphobasidiales sp. Tagirdzhanova-0007]